MKINELFSGIKCTIPETEAAETTDVISVTYDSRKAGKGSLFICLVGVNSDGHDYAASAYENGCRTFFTQKTLDLPEDAVQIIAENTRSVLPYLSSNFYQHPERKLTLIGVTGTKGKTTTALILRELLNKNAKACAYIGTNGIQYAGKNIETPNTTPESLVLEASFHDMVENGIKYVVMEVSSQALKYHRVDNLVFDTTIFTNLSVDHIGPGEHSSFEDYRDSKKRLFTEHHTSHIIYNLDDEYAGAMVDENTTAEKISYSTADPSASYYATDIKPWNDNGSSLGVQFVSHHNGEAQEIEAHFPGKFSVHNLLSTIAAAGIYGIDQPSCFKTLHDVHADGRFEVIKTGLPGRAFIIDYAHNGVSLTAALSILKEHDPKRLIVIVGAVGGRTQSRRAEVGKAIDPLVDIAMLTADEPNFEDPMNVINDIASVMHQCPKILKYPDREDAVRAAVRMSQPGDIFLFAGKGHETTQLIKGVHVPFSEKKILLDEAAKMIAESK
ncbi:MAG: UDP-N-acetylmuramoyl-L-alanyl-D-glutamate--2,6-diaminopimelate ligase [Eubacterium sp.]|nr:UDP-N-acetylmuramoyl-L-alanyl-D-glutamate--2,6-diaminopimelate ligase [Eubacterium sp.]